MRRVKDIECEKCGNEFSASEHMGLWGLLIIATCFVSADSALTTLFPATDARIQFTGRSVVDQSTRLFDWSSSYIEVNAVGPLDCAEMFASSYGRSTVTDS